MSNAFLRCLSFQICVWQMLSLERMIYRFCRVPTYLQGCCAVAAVLLGTSLEYESVWLVLIMFSKCWGPVVFAQMRTAVRLLSSRCDSTGKGSDGWPETWKEYCNSYSCGSVGVCMRVCTRACMCVCANTACLCVHLTGFKSKWA